MKRGVIVIALVVFVAALVASRYDLCGWSRNCMAWRHLDTELHDFLLHSAALLAAALVGATEAGSALYNVGVGVAVLRFVYKFFLRVYGYDLEHGGEMLDWLGVPVPQWLVDFMVYIGAAPPGSIAKP